MAERNSKISTDSINNRPISMALPKEPIISACTSLSPVAVSLAVPGRVSSLTAFSKSVVAVPRATPSGKLAPIIARRWRL